MIAEEIFRSHKGKDVVLDANLLLLFLIGTFQRERISAFKRTAQFSAEEFDALQSVLTHFRRIITTPHLLTEVSNLSNSLPEHLKAAWSDHFAAAIHGLVEVLHPASDIAAESAFNPFGLTDAAVQNASAAALVLTEDFRLSGYLRSLGIATLNFREILPSPSTRT